MGIIVLVAVHQSWEAVKYATEVGLPTMIEAVRQDWRAIQCFFCEELSEAELCALTHTNPHIVRAPAFKRSKMAWLNAVRQNGLILQFATLDMRENREIVVSAIQENPQAFHYAAPSMRRDAEVLSCAMQHKQTKVAKLGIAAPSPTDKGT